LRDIAVPGMAAGAGYPPMRLLSPCEYSTIRCLIVGAAGHFDSAQSAAAISAQNITTIEGDTYVVRQFTSIRWYARARPTC
jgi:hypothetical protein